MPDRAAKWPADSRMAGQESGFTSKDGDFLGFPRAAFRVISECGNRKDIG
jgi:hypothetical protein